MNRMRGVKDKRCGFGVSGLLCALVMPLWTMAAAPLCDWREISAVGALPGYVNEASGIAASRRYPDRLYHVSDSGEIDPEGKSRGFLQTDPTGADARPVAIDGYAPRDLEDLAVGRCDRDGADDCLYLADIGDNARRRDEVTITLVREQAEFAARVPKFATLRLRYPDAPRDAESLAVQPDGSILILTKEYRFDGGLRAGDPARLYRLPAARRQPAATAPALLEHVADFDFAALRPDSSARALIATAMDLSPDGERLLMLFYDGAIELVLDAGGALPATTQWQQGVTFQRIPLRNQLQQEGIGYGPDGRSLFYTTERPFGRGETPTPILRAACRQ
ncbi:MAG: hypothetical protein IT494_04895 [Gammaproteobacteria bacterium]|nr:hypothetical protein [Gammaproteobacteria bacterium]